jgi:hypothetical protein
MIGCPSHADLAARLSALSWMAPAPSPVVSVYLNTYWSNEHQRARARVFLKNEIRRARVGATAEEPWLRRVEGVAALLRYPV